MRTNAPRSKTMFILTAAGLIGLLLAVASGVEPQVKPSGPSSPAVPAAASSLELPVHRIPNLPEAAEWYFAPDGKFLVGNAKGPGDATHHVYVSSFDGSDIRRVNGLGQDACSYFFPDGRHVLWTSTRDLPDLPAGNWSDANDYPQGAEIYSSDLNGHDIKRLTNNRV